MTSKKKRKKVSPGLSIIQDSSIVNIEEAFKKLNSNQELNKDNILAMIKKFVFQDVNSQHFQDVNYQHSEALVFGTEVFVPGCTLLHMVARFNCDILAGFLIEARAKVDSKDMLGCTHLHYAAIDGDNIEVAKVLITNGANVNEQDIYRIRPLYYALDNGYPKIARLLIANGAQINNKEILQALNDRQNLNKDNVIEMMRKCIPHLVKDSSDVNYSRHKIMYYGSFKPILIHCTLLHIAAAFDCDILAKLLIERGADVNLKDARGRTPLQVALEKDHLKTAKLLIDKGADRSCVPAYITKTSKLEGEATAVMMVIITTAVIPLVLIENTELSASVIIGATIASMLIVGSIAFGLAYMWKKHELSSKLDKAKCENATPRLPQPTE